MERCGVGYLFDPLNDTFDWFIRPDMSYQGKTYTDESNLAWINDYWLVNMRTGIEKNGLRIEAFVRNLFDDDNYRAAASRNDFRHKTSLRGLRTRLSSSLRRKSVHSA